MAQKRGHLSIAECEVIDITDDEIDLRVACMRLAERAPAYMVRRLHRIMKAALQDEADSSSARSSRSTSST